MFFISPKTITRRRSQNAAKALMCTTLLLTPLLLEGCAFFRETIGLGAQRPRVQLAGIQVNKVTLGSMELTVSIKVDNPNDFELRFAKLAYNLTAAELTLAAGNYDKKITIPPTGTAYVKLPLTIDAANAMKLAEHLLKSPEETQAVMKAKADFDSAFGALEVNFEDKRPLSKIVSHL
jgi:LEA14-like dessication related protein